MKDMARNEKRVSSALAQFVTDLPWGEEDGPQPTVRLEFKGEREAHVRMKIDRIGKDHKDAEKRLAAILPKDAVKELLASEDRLFTWLGKDKSHPTRFALDPVASLAEAGIKLSDQAATTLQLHRDTQKRVYDTSATKSLASLRIEVAGSETKSEK